MKYNLRLTSELHGQLKAHLFPGDGKEAIAFALCGRLCTSNQTGLLVHKLLLVPYELCDRKGDFIEWPTDYIDSLIDEAAANGMGLLKIHSHPEGFDQFSELDDHSDQIIFPSVYALMNDEQPHYSAIMFNDGSIIARVFFADNTFTPIDRISIVGESIKLYIANTQQKSIEANLRNTQTFGQGTTSMLKGLKIAVIGCSGTGSITIEQLARLGIGQMVIADPDLIEFKNLNRIINSTHDDANNNRPKVEVLNRAIKSFGFETETTPFQSLLQDSRPLLEAIMESDFIFGCVDSVEGRNLLNLISTFYLIPYIDMGVKLVTDKKGGIDEISGSVHYIQPGKSSLLSRGVYSLKELASEDLKRNSPQMYEEQKKNGYVIDMDVESPAVIPINMQTASLAVMEFLARIHPYRYDANKRFAHTNISLSDWEIWTEEETTEDKYLKKFVGRGNAKPILNSPSIDKLW